MRLSDSDTSEHLTQATAHFLTDLHRILETRAEALAEIEAQEDALTSSDREEAIVEAYAVAKNRYLLLRRSYNALLRDNLPPYLVERIKDGLTHNFLPELHALYLDMVPALTPVEKAHIYGLLIEARENVMMAITPDAQEQWIDKYRGIINNYIAAQGHDFTQLSKAWNAANSESRWAH